LSDLYFASSKAHLKKTDEGTFVSMGSPGYAIIKNAPRNSVNMVRDKNGEESALDVYFRKGYFLLSASKEFLKKAVYPITMELRNNYPLFIQYG